MMLMKMMLGMRKTMMMIAVMVTMDKIGKASEWLEKYFYIYNIYNTR
jgi:hypothetical protein